MSWSDNPVIGSQSVAANKAPINNAFQYIATSMKVDHFWDNANNQLDGHHQFVQMPKFSSGGPPPLPTIGSSMDGVYYCREKTAAEAPALQTVEPFYLSNDGTQDQVLQLGFRCIALFQGRASNGVCTIGYSHNLDPTNLVQRTGTGQYTIHFSTPMPSTRYLVFVSNQINFNPMGPDVFLLGAVNITPTHPKTVNSVSVVFTNTSATLLDPNAIIPTSQVIIIGG